MDARKNTFSVLDYILESKQILDVKKVTNGSLILKESCSLPDTIKIEDYNTLLFSFLIKKRVAL